MFQKTFVGQLLIEKMTAKRQSAIEIGKTINEMREEGLDERALIEFAAVERGLDQNYLMVWNERGRVRASYPVQPNWQK